MRNRAAGNFAGSNKSSGNQDGPGADARFHNPCGITVDPAGNMVVVDHGNRALRLVSKAGAVSTLAGGGGGASQTGRVRPRASIARSAWW